jgi:hypothetical protein
VKASDGFVLRNIAGERMLLPTGERIAAFRGAVLMNELSAFIWEKLQSPITRDGLLAEILAQYAIDEETAAADLDAVLAQLKQMGIIEA